MSEEHRTIEKSIENIEKNFDEHRQEDMRNFGDIHTTLRDMKDNHLAHIQDSTAKQGTDIDWIKRIMWLFLVPIIGGFIAQIYQLVD